jgi:hypothetical protein
VVIFDYYWCEVITRCPDHGDATRRLVEEVEWWCRTVLSQVWSPSTMVVSIMSELMTCRFVSKLIMCWS